MFANVDWNRFNPEGILAGEAGAVVLFGAAIAVFSKKDLHI